MPVPTAQFRNVSADKRLVWYGVIGSKLIAAGDILTVEAEVAGSYASQPRFWEPVDANATKALDTTVSGTPEVAAPPAAKTKAKETS